MDRRALVRGTGLVRSAPHARVVRHSEQPHLRLDEQTARVGMFREPSNNANGNTVDREGRLVSCEHLSRRVTRTEHDGTITVLADRWQGKRLNSPNDVVVHSDGGIWFTDPSYGILSDYEGERADSEIGACHRLPHRPGTAVPSTRWRTTSSSRTAWRFRSTNRCSTSPTPVPASTGRAAPHPPPHGEQRRPWARVLAPAKSLFATCTEWQVRRLPARPRGSACGAARRDGVHAYTPDGRLLGKVLIPERVANVCFGGPKRNRLFICATSSLYSVYLKVNGL